MSADAVSTVATGTDLAVVERSSLGVFDSDWNTLVEGSALPTPFLRSWWLDSVGSEHACFVLALRRDELVGGLALERRSLLGVEHYRFLGGGRLCPDHLDLVARPGHEDEVCAALFSWFRSRRSRILDLRGIAENATVLGLYPGRLRPDDVAPYQRMPATAAEYLAGRSSNFRRSTRRTERQLTQRGGTLKRVAEPDIESALDDFAQIQRSRGDREALLEEWPRLRSAVMTGAACGEARVYAAEFDGARAAVVVAFAFAGRLSLYQVARRTERQFSGLGTVMLMTAVNDAVQSGMDEVDFLRGGESYKADFARYRRRLWRLRVGSDPLIDLMVGMWTSSSRLRNRCAESLFRIRDLGGSMRGSGALVGHVQSWTVRRPRKHRVRR